MKPEQQSGGAVTKSKDGGDVLSESKATNASEALSSMDVLHKNSYEMTELDEDDCQQLSEHVINKLSVDDLADIKNYTSNGKDEKTSANGDTGISITTEVMPIYVLSFYCYNKSRFNFTRLGLSLRL